jgi:putative Ca2+/H+ antiporter (TMEM165/GDT1 family)
MKFVKKKLFIFLTILQLLYCSKINNLKKDESEYFFKNDFQLSENKNFTDRFSIIEEKKHGKKFISVESSTFQIQTNQTSLLPNIDYYILISGIGGKSFICVLLLFFTTNPYTLFFTSAITKILLIYMKRPITMNIVYFFPLEMFKIIAIIMYNLFGFCTLYNLMFCDFSKEKLILYKKNKNKFHNTDIQYTNIFRQFFNNIFNEIDSISKILGLISISELIEYNTGSSINFISNSNLDPMLNPMGGNSLLNFTLNSISTILSFSCAIFISFLFSKKFNLECNLLLTSITFLLLGIDISIKCFSA